MWNCIRALSPLTVKKREGATFTVTLPLGKGHFRPEDITDPTIDTAKRSITWLTTEPEQTTTPAATDRQDVPSIVVVEDNEDLLTFIEGLLHSEYQVITARDGKSGLDQCLDTVPDLVLCDVACYLVWTVCRLPAL